MTSISVLFPSRGRPARARAAIDSIFATAAKPDRVVVNLLLDRDDELLSDYVFAAPSRTVIHIEERRMSAPGLYNVLATECCNSTLLVAGSDDVLFRTPGWDDEFERLSHVWPDGLFVGYAADAADRAMRDRCEHFVTSAAWVKTVGYFMRREYEHFSADEHVGDIAQRVGRLVAVPQVVIEHCHKKYGKAPDDASYRAKRTADAGGLSVSQRDRERFRDFAPERQRAAERVRLEMARFLEAAA